MYNQIIFFMTCFVTSWVSACPATGSLCEQQLQNGQKNRQGNVVGRSYQVFIPPNANQQLPVMFVFHGSGGDSSHHIAKYSGFVALAKQHQFIAVFPAGLKDHDGKPHWNDGRKSFNWHFKNVDDIQFVTNIINDLKKHQINIDHHKIYAAGISNGGLFTHWMACNKPGFFSAVASVAATMTRSMFQQVCQQNAKPIPIMVIFGDKDKVMPYNKNAGIGRKGENGQKSMGVAIFKTLSRWSTTNGCQQKTVKAWKSLNQHAPEINQVKKITQTFRKENTTYAITKARGCQKPVVYIEARGAGHRWHNKDQQKEIMDFTPAWRVSREFDSQKMIWDFVSKY